MEQCPREPLLYYCAARLELRQVALVVSHMLPSTQLMPPVQSSHHELVCRKAVKWLELCVRQYYSISEGEESALDHALLYRWGGCTSYLVIHESGRQLPFFLHLLFCRKLLGLVVPYDFSPPNLSEMITSEQRREQLVPLWLCYWYDMT